MTNLAPEDRHIADAQGHRAFMACLAGTVLLLTTTAGAAATPHRAPDQAEAGRAVFQQDLGPGQIEVISLYPDDAPDSRDLAVTNAEFAAKFPGSAAV